MQSDSIAIAVVAVGLALAAPAPAEEPKLQKAPAPGKVEMMRAPAPQLAPDAAALRAKLVKAQADLTALARQPAPAGVSPRDLDALKALQNQDRELARKLGGLISELDGGAAASDLGQQLQLALQEANNIYQRSTQSQANVLKKHHETTDSIISNMK